MKGERRGREKRNMSGGEWGREGGEEVKGGGGGGEGRWGGGMGGEGRRGRR